MMSVASKGSDDAAHWLSRAKILELAGCRDAEKIDLRWPGLRKLYICKYCQDASLIAETKVHTLHSLHLLFA